MLDAEGTMNMGSVVQGFHQNVAVVEVPTMWHMEGVKL